MIAYLILFVFVIAVAHVVEMAVLKKEVGYGAMIGAAIALCLSVLNLAIATTTGFNPLYKLYVGAANLLMN